MANGMVSGIISITLGVIMISSVFLPQVHGTNTDAFSTAEVALWAVLGLGGVIGILYGIFAVFGLV